MRSPLIGVTVDNKDNTATSGRYESAIAYSRAVTQAGGVPLLLPHEPELADRYVALCDGILLTGGADARMERFGQAMHPQANPVDGRRQEFDLAILDALDRAAAKPTLAVCLGMQFMALHAGGRLNQHLPDLIPSAETVHRHNARHGVRVMAADSVVLGGRDAERPEAGAAPGEADMLVVSAHHQGVENPGRLRAVAVASDGVIEAVDDPGRAFYLGVQWHPERGGEGLLSSGLIQRFVRACRGPTA